MSEQEHTDNDPKELPLVAHLIELRDRILRSVAVVLALFIVLYSFFKDQIYDFVAKPLASILENSEVATSMITTNPMDGFLIPMKLSFMSALFLSIPYILHQAWAFISPGLYKNEIKVTMPILMSSVILFYTGLAFCYFIVQGFLFQFFIEQAPDSVAVMTDIGAFYNFVMKLFLIFGVVFEIPVAIILLVMSGVTTPKDLTEKRSYIIIGCFCVAVPLTPPDPGSLFLMAVPMWMLFEVGILLSRIFYRPDPVDEEREKEASASDS